MWRRRREMFVSGFFYGSLFSILCACVVLCSLTYRKWKGEALARGQPEYSFGLSDQLFIDHWLPLPEDGVLYKDLEGPGVSDGEFGQIREAGLSVLDGKAVAYVLPGRIKSSPIPGSNGAVPPGWDAVYQGDGAKVFTRCTLVSGQLCPKAHGDAAYLVLGTRSLEASLGEVFSQVLDYVGRTGQPAALSVEVIQGEGDKVPSALAVGVRSADNGLSVHRVLYNMEPGYQIDYRAGYAVCP